MDECVPQAPRGGVVVVFDGWCGVCTRTARVLVRMDRRDRISIAPSQGPGVLERFGLSEAEAASAAWAFDESGGRYRGAAAVNRALDAAIGWRVCHAFYRLPGIRQLQDLGYRWIAEHRGRLPGTTPWCESHPGACL